MVKLFSPPPGAAGRDQHGVEVLLEPYRGYRIKRSRRSEQFAGIVVALVGPEGQTAHVLVSRAIYFNSVRVEGKKEHHGHHPKKPS